MIEPNATPEPIPTDPAAPALNAAPSTGGRRPDPGTRSAARLAAILSFILIPAVVFLQQCEPREAPAPAAPAQPATLAGTPESDQFSMVARMMVKVYHAFKSGGTQNDAQMLARTIGKQLDESADPGHSAFAISRPDPEVVRLNKLRAAIAAGEFEGDEEALKRINTLANPPASEADAAGKAEKAAAEKTPAEAAANPDAEAEGSLDIAPDLEPLRLIYSGHASELTDDQRAALVQRQGWWGKLALSRGLPDSDPGRAAVVGGGGAIIAAVMLIGAVMLLGAVGAIGAFIFMLVKLGSGTLRRRFVPPAPGGSVYLESLALFAAAFIALKVGGGLAVKFLHAPEAAIIVAQWSLMIIPFWPLLRGVSFAEHRRLIGWNTGRGVFREIGCGVLGYLAGLVPFFFATLISLFFLLAKFAIESSAGKKITPPRNPVVEELLHGSVWEVVLLGALATIWAPIVEEAIFRGSLFRHLRARLPLLGAALISAIVFGVMHPYPVFLLLPVITLGFIFALMREWRGSLIAPMTAHALHNGTLVAMLVLFLTAMKD